MTKLKPKRKVPRRIKRESRWFRIRHNDRIFTETHVYYCDKGELVELACCENNGDIAFTGVGVFVRVKNRMVMIKDRRHR